MISLKKGFTILEMIIAIFIMLSIMAISYKFYLKFFNIFSKEKIKSQLQAQLQDTFEIIEDDIRHASFGLLKQNNGICLYVIDDNCTNSALCVPGTDRLFIGDGWQIIRDFTVDNCPDGDISDATYQVLVSRKFYANVISYTMDSKSIVLDRIDIDNTCRNVNNLCGSENSCDDLLDNKAFIICGCQNLKGEHCQEGRRISSVDKISRTLTFLANSRSLSCYKCNGAKVVPAIVWYVKKDKNNNYWLYRNQQKVIKNVVDFVVCAGYDLNGDGIVSGNFDGGKCNGEYLSKIPNNASFSKLKFLVVSIKMVYKWRDKNYYIEYHDSVETFH